MIVDSSQFTVCVRLSAGVHVVNKTAETKKMQQVSNKKYFHNRFLL